MNIFEWMLSEQLVDNSFSASHVYKGLKLKELESFDEQKERVKLYRKWRPKTDKKNMLPTKQAFELAIAGIDPADVQERQIEMEIVE